MLFDSAKTRSTLYSLNSIDNYVKNSGEDVLPRSVTFLITNFNAAIGIQLKNACITLKCFTFFSTIVYCLERSFFAFLADFAYLIRELRSNCLHLGNKCARIVIPSARLLNHGNKSASHNFGFTLLLSPKHITSLKTSVSPERSKSFPYWFQGNFVAMFV